MTAAEPRILRIETAAADALVCRERVDDDGWRLRSNDGVTRRGNSVFPGRAGRDRLADKIDRAEAFYRDRGSVPRFQLTAAAQPPQLSVALAERGYHGQPGAGVETAPLADVIAATRTEAPMGAVRIDAAPTTGWLGALGRGSGEAQAALAVRAGNLAAFTGSKAFATLLIDDAVAAVGFAALEDGARPGRWLGVFNMATAPAFRRRGAARRVLAALALWGRAQGAERAYLQVHPANRGAQALYTAVGFTLHHHYDYWEMGGAAVTSRARNAHATACRAQ